MDHSEALRTKAAERYLLGEMPAGERDQYEEHFFACVECAQEVQAGAAFIDSAKEALAASGAPVILAKPKASSAGWWTWLLRPAFAVPAMALVLFALVYQTAFEIPALKSRLSEATVPQTTVSLSLIAANSRGGETPETSFLPDKPLSLVFDIPPERKFPSYICEVQADSGAIEFFVNVSAEEAKGTVEITIPPHRLAVGNYALIVQGYESTQQASKTEVARFPFTLNLSH